jgi:hypothetical protein
MLSKPFINDVKSFEWVGAAIEQNPVWNMSDEEFFIDPFDDALTIEQNWANIDTKVSELDPKTIIVILY